MIDLESHREIFAWALSLLARRQQLKGKSLGIDAMTLEANSALRSIVRRDSGESELEMRSYISEPKRPRRRWKGQHAVRDAVYANRRRIARAKGKRLLALRAERVERSFAHCLETGAIDASTCAATRTSSSATCSRRPPSTWG